MRKLKLTLWMLMGVMCMPIFMAAAPEWANDALRYRWNESGAYPSFIRFKSGAGPEFFQIYPFLKGALGLQGDEQLRLLRTQTDAFGYTHYDFQQIHAGYPVMGAIYKVHMQGGRTVAMNGRIERVQATPPAHMTEAEALGHALRQVGAQRYVWEMPAEVEALRHAMRNPQADFFPKGVLTWVKPGNPQAAAPHRLAWCFDIYAQQPISRAELYMDAQTGGLIFRNEKIHTADVNGTAVTFYSGQQNIVTDSTGALYRLRETGRAGGVETYNMQNGTNYGQAVDFTDLDNFWNNINANNDQAAADGHWGAEMTHDYYLLKHGRSSFDGQGSPLLSYIHFDQNYANAFWDGTRMTYGSSSNNSRPFCALDVVGHEFSHGVTGSSAGLIYQNESGALNESFSDIFGAAIEFYARPGNANWEIGEDIGGIRNMANPALFNNPDTYLGNYWVTGGFDNGGVHTNSGVQNFWFYLLSEGGSGTNDNGDSYTVSPLGIDTAAMIAFRNLTTYLGPSDQYEDARYYAIESASDLFGDCSHQVIQTMNAWHAVGVGIPYTGTLQAGFYTPDTNNCLIPSTVSFQNNSQSAFQYLWLFGDGGTSTDINPSHTYTQPGTYTVTLIAYGCNGSIDTIVLADHVVLDPNAPCVINMPGGNEDVTHTGCAGELYDSGGSGNYLDNSFSTVTIQVPAGSVVNLSFLSFHFAAGDNLRIYDGPNTLSPTLGVYSGTTLPPAFTSSGNSITIRESTNGANTQPGFHAMWSCAVGNEDAWAQALELYPNPAHDRLHFQLKGNTTALQYQLVDLQGRVLLRGEGQGAQQQTLHTGEIPAGIYFLRLESEGRQHTRKVVLRH